MTFQAPAREANSPTLVEELRRAAVAHAYCRIELAQPAGSGFVVANGQLVIGVPLAAGETPSVQHATIVAARTLLAGAIAAQTTFRISPLVDVPNADALPHVAIDSLLPTVAEPGVSATNATDSALPPPPISAPPVPSQAPMSEPALLSPSATTAPAPPVADVAPTPSRPLADEVPPRRIRASQLRRILREGGSLDDHLGEAPQPATEIEPSRSAALRELIGELASG